MGKNIVIVGAVALGSKAGSRLKRLEPDANVIMIDRDEYISYGGCGIPYYVSGDVSDVSELRATSFHMVRDENFFKNVKDIRALSQTEVLKINRDEKTVLIRNNQGVESTLPYDKLVLGTGSKLRKLDIAGKSLKNIFGVGSLKDAIDIKELITKGNIEKAVIIGAGFIGLEMAEALSDMWGIETTVIEYFDQIMPGFVSKKMANMGMCHMEENDVKFYLGEKVTAFEGEEYIQKVRTDKRTIDADLVIMSVGVEPCSYLAKEAGLDILPNGCIVVNENLETSDPDIYAGGDCIATKNLLTNKLGFYPLGSLANRQGRVIGTNLSGGKATFKGAVGSFVVKLFETSLAGAGLSLDKALDAGFDAISVLVSQLDRAHFYPEKDLMFLEIVVEKITKRVLGIQGFGSKNDAMVGRINAVAAMLKYKPLIEDISNLELAYSPPFASAMDIINALGNVAENLLDGHFKPVSCENFADLWEKREDNKVFFLDCRAKGDGLQYENKYPDHWKNIPQDELKKRINEVPSDRDIVLICNTGVRSYEALINLNSFGFKRVNSLEGGIVTVKKWGLDI